MTTNFQRTADWLAACGKTPDDKTLSVQLGCHLEETLELWECVEFSALGLPDELQQDIAAEIVKALVVLAGFADGMKKGRVLARISDDQRAEALDALCDAEVTGNGVAYFAGFNKPAADAAVLAANEAKLVDGKPVILEGGKIGKPEGWTAPDLAAFV